ncbi:MAG: hypothetical protein PHH08_02065 [Candidatus ainarchaeum sp.]|nr:hypothetical protein [Candidatus ainarchaeum sp.]
MIESVLFFAVLALLLPGTGFFLSLAFFPKNRLDWLERIVFSAVLGLVFPALLLLLENQVFGIPITFVSALCTIVALLAAGIAAFKLQAKKE